MFAGGQEHLYAFLLFVSCSCSREFKISEKLMRFCEDRIRITGDVRCEVRERGT